jgi:hypothetical protein
MPKHILLALGAACLLTAAAHAQPTDDNRHPRSGFYFAGGLGVGSAGAECDPCGEIDRETGLSGTLRLGGSLSQTVQLGVSTNGWFKQEDNVTSTLGFLSFAVTLYPSSRGGFYLQLGLGGMFGKIEDDLGNEITTLGPGALLGLGFDIRIGRNVSLTPYANALAARGNLEVNEVEILDENFNPNLIQFGLAITAH